MQQNKHKVAFIHPDLGIGGAEQLVINLGLALKQKKVEVCYFTPYHDPQHCFPDTVNGNLKVKVCGNWIPANFFGKFTALCAMIRVFLATLYVLIFEKEYDTFIVDQVTVGLPLIKIFGKKSIFYCHFPDKLLCVDRSSLFKRVYRFFIDIFEEICLLSANIILVNSLFTQKIYNDNFSIVRKIKGNPQVLYPTMDFNQFKQVDKDDELLKIVKDQKFFCSINRYERKKNIGLAISSFAKFIEINGNDKNSEQFVLIIAGGYEERQKENQEYYLELLEMSQKHNLQDKVIFLKNVSSELKSLLLSRAVAILYTPENEHFGIVPIESMYNETPVIAMNSGGPKESILNEKTGFLINGTQSEKWAEKMQILAQNPERQKKMGKDGKNRVIQLFGFEQFVESIYNTYVNVNQNQNNILKGQQKKQE